MTSSTRRASASSTDSCLTAMPAPSSRLLTRTRPAWSRTSQPTVTTSSVSPGTTTMRAARSSMRRYRASSSGPDALGETEHVERERAPPLQVVGLDLDVAKPLRSVIVVSAVRDHRPQRARRVDAERAERRGVVDGARHVDGVRQPGVRVPPVPLQRLVHAQRVAAGAGEDLVDGGDRTPRGTHLGAAPGRAVLERDLLARVDDVVDPVDVGEQFLAGGVDVGGGLADGEQHVGVVLDRGAAGADAVALVVEVSGQRALGDADHGGGDAEREHRRPRHVVQRLGHARPRIWAVPSITSSRPSSGSRGRTRP